MDNEIMIGFQIRRKSDAELVAQLLAICQRLAGVRVEDMGGGFAVFAGGPFEPARVEQLQAYAQGAVDTLRMAAGELNDKPAA